MFYLELLMLQVLSLAAFSILAENSRLHDRVETHSILNVLGVSLSNVIESFKKSSNAYHRSSTQNHP